MKNKIVAIILVFSIVFAMSTTILAAASTEIILTTSKDKIDKDTKEVILTLKLGEQTGVQTGKPAGYLGSIEYSTDVFESVDIMGMNGWSATIANGKIQGDTSQVAANQEIAKITLK